MKPKHLISIIFAVIILAGLAWWASARYPSTPSPAVNNLPTPPDQANWKTYRNEEFGFEFRYPSTIAGQPVTITAPLPNTYNRYEVFNSQIPTGEFFDFKGERKEVFVGMGLSFSASRITDDFAYGMAIDGGEGIFYDATRDAWYRGSRNHPETWVTWDEFISNLEENTKGHYGYTTISLPMVSSGIIIDPREQNSLEKPDPGLGGGYEFGYKILNREKKIVINFSVGSGAGVYNFNTLSSQVQSELKREDAALRLVVPQIIKTLSFF